MSGAFVRKYSDDQREAMISARLDRGMTYRRVVELARAGQLTGRDGTRLEPFDPPISTLASLARDAKARRMGKVVSELASREPRDAFEILRRRLLNSADAMLEAEEKRKPEDRSADRQRDIARMAREAAAIRPPTDEPSRKPGQRENGKQPEATTQSGMAGSILAAHRTGEGSPASDAHTQQTHTEKEGAADEAPRADAQQHDEAEERGPGSGSVARAAARSSLAAA